MWAYNNAFVDWCISTCHILYWIFRSHTHHWVLDFFCSTSAIIGTTIQLGEFFNWGKRFSFCIVILTECYQCTSVYDNRTESINPQNAMWCHPVENPWRRHHQCASSTKAEPSLLPSTTRASSRWKAQAVYTGVTFHRLPSSNSAKTSSLSRSLSRWQALPAAKA